MSSRTIAIGLLALVLGIVVAPAAHASCLPTTRAAQRAQADVIFDGIALHGPTSTGVQSFRVVRYLKGHGPRVARVQTGVIRRADGSGSLSSVSIMVQRLERWRIFGRGSSRDVLRTTVCAGSRKR